MLVGLLQCGSACCAYCEQLNMHRLYTKACMLGSVAATSAFEELLLMSLWCSCRSCAGTQQQTEDVPAAAAAAQQGFALPWMPCLPTPGKQRLYFLLGSPRVKGDRSRMGFYEQGRTGAVRAHCSVSTPDMWCVKCTSTRATSRSSINDNRHTRKRCRQRSCSLQRPSM
jgi:hypothetical protein